MQKCLYICICFLVFLKPVKICLVLGERCLLIFMLALCSCKRKEFRQLYSYHDLFNCKFDRFISKFILSNLNLVDAFYLFLNKPTDIQVASFTKCGCAKYFFCKFYIQANVIFYLTLRLDMFSFS